jgi:hypothetical protein
MLVCHIKPTLFKTPTPYLIPTLSYHPILPPYSTTLFYHHPNRDKAGAAYVIYGKASGFSDMDLASFTSGSAGYIIQVCIKPIYMLHMCIKPIYMLHICIKPIYMLHMCIKPNPSMSHMAPTSYLNPPFKPIGSSGG